MWRDDTKIFQFRDVAGLCATARHQLNESRSGAGLDRSYGSRPIAAETDTVGKNRDFDTVVVHKLDRLFRNSLESSTTRAILKREKVRLISVTEPMVGSDAPEDFFMEHLLVGMAEFYSRNLSREIMKGLKQRALQGHLVLRIPERNHRTAGRPQTDPDYQQAGSR